MDSVSLFVTCLVDMFRPEAGQAAVRVLERRGYSVNFPTAQTCCGQFSYNTGYAEEASRLARHWIEAFETTPDPIVALSGSCAAMVIHTYPDLIATDMLRDGHDAAAAESWKLRAEAVGRRVFELTQTLSAGGSVIMPDPKNVDAEPVVMVYHLGCHMRRVLGATTAADAVMAVSGVRLVEPEDADQCCGFGGTYSLTEPMVSTALADAKWRHICAVAERTGALGLTSADLGCLLHLEGRASRAGNVFPCRHVAEILDLQDEGRLTSENIERRGR